MSELRSKKFLYTTPFPKKKTLRRAGHKALVQPRLYGAFDEPLTRFPDDGRFFNQNLTLPPRTPKLLFRAMTPLYTIGNDAPPRVVY